LTLDERIGLLASFENYFRIGSDSPGTPEFVTLALISRVGDFSSTDQANGK
jgi:hypothetical protein